MTGEFDYQPGGDAPAFPVSWRADDDAVFFDGAAPGYCVSVTVRRGPDGTRMLLVPCPVDVGLVNACLVVEMELRQGWGEAGGGAG